MIGAIVAKRKASSGFNALNRHDINAFMNTWAEDATYIFPGNLSISGETKGKEAIREVFRKFLERFPLINFNVKNIFIQNIFALGSTNIVAAEWGLKYKNQEGGEFEKTSNLLNKS